MVRRYLEPTKVRLLSMGTDDGHLYTGSLRKGYSQYPLNNNSYTLTLLRELLLDSTTTTTTGVVTTATLAAAAAVLTASSLNSNRL